MAAIVSLCVDMSGFVPQDTVGMSPVINGSFALQFFECDNMIGMCSGLPEMLFRCTAVLSSQPAMAEESLL